MFIYTLKASSIKFFAVILLSVAVLVTIVTLIPDLDTIGEVAAVSIEYDGIKSESDRHTFLKQFGYEFKPTPIETTDVTIPEEFDSVYEEYNNIQRAQGLNLKKYKGKKATRFTYEITNYDYDETVLATMIVYKNRIIAGDVCSVEGIGKADDGKPGNGFIHGFEKPFE